jgi:hypothetical protein
MGHKITSAVLNEPIKGIKEETERILRHQEKATGALCEHRGVFPALRVAGDGRKQGLRDKIAGTVVVKTRGRNNANLPLHRGD